MSNPSPAVLICGMPASGNRLCLAHVKRSTPRPARDPQSRVYHFGKGPEADVSRTHIARYDHFICPQRDPATWRLAMEKRAREASKANLDWVLTEAYQDGHRACMEMIKAALADRGRGSLHMVQLEAIVGSGGAVLDRVLDAVGLSPARWPDEDHRKSHFQGRLDMKHVAASKYDHQPH